MKYTLLDLVQTILSSMDSDEVNSINDTAEAMQVATVVRSAYYDIISRGHLPETCSLITLDPSLDVSKPTLMYLPNNVSAIKWLTYNYATSNDPEINMTPVSYVPLDEFLSRMDHMTEGQNNVFGFDHTVGTDTYRFLYENDRHPSIYTSFDDHTLVFNSYDVSVDHTLQKSKTRAYGVLRVDFKMEDDFIPILDEPHFPLLLNEAKSLAWLELKQSQHPKAEQNARRGWTHLQKAKHSAGRMKDFDELPNFGRRR